MSISRIRLLDLSIKNDDNNNKLVTFEYHGSTDFIPFNIIDQYNLSIVRFSTSIREMPIWINDGTDYIEFDYLKGTQKLTAKNYFDSSIKITNYHTFLRVLNNTIYKSYIEIMDQMYPLNNVDITQLNNTFNLENDWTVRLDTLQLRDSLPNASNMCCYYLDIEIDILDDASSVAVDIIFTAPGEVTSDSKKYIILAKNVILKKSNRVLFTDGSLNNVQDADQHFLTKYSDYRPFENFYNLYNRKHWQKNSDHFSFITIKPTDDHSVIHSNIRAHLKCVDPISDIGTLSPIFDIDVTNNRFVYDVSETFIASGIKLKCNKRLLNAIQLDDSKSKHEFHYPDLTFSNDHTEYIKINALNNRALNIIQYRRIIITSSDMNIVRQENNDAIQQNIITDYILPIQLSDNDTIIFNIVNDWRKFTLNSMSSRNLEFKMYLEYNDGNSKQIELGNSESSDLMILFERDNGM